LILTLTEKLTPSSRPPRWDKLAAFSSTCDPSVTLPVPVRNEPIVSADGLTVSIVLDNDSKDEVPALGNCLYLDSRSKEFKDRVGNLPTDKGARLDGKEKAVNISQLRAYPPVVGLETATASKGCFDERHLDDNTWIVPYGFNPEKGIVDVSEVNSCSESKAETQTRASRIPSCMSIVEVVSDGAYVADIAIFDNLGNFVNASRQQFGHCGELSNLNRSVAGKKRSYLVWNSRDSHGERVGNGVYVWSIRFTADKSDGTGPEKVLVRTGFLRTSACAD
jgi:hypothetical protein